MRKILVASVMVLVALAAGIVISKYRGGTGRTNLTPEAAVAKLVAEYNKTLPAMIDSYTRLDRVTGVARRIVYHYSLVSYPAGGRDLIDDPERAKWLENGIVTHVCTSEQMRPARDLGVTFIYEYTAADGKRVLQFEVGPERCLSGAATTR